MEEDGYLFISVCWCWFLIFVERFRAFGGNEGWRRTEVSHGIGGGGEEAGVVHLFDDCVTDFHFAYL